MGDGTWVVAVTVIVITMQVITMQVATLSQDREMSSGSDQSVDWILSYLWTRHIVCLKASQDNKKLSFEKLR